MALPSPRLAPVTNAVGRAMAADSTLRAREPTYRPPAASAVAGHCVVPVMPSPHRPFLLSHLIPDAADRDADAPALTDGTDRLTHGQLEGRVGRLAAALRAHGVRDGDRVMIHAPKSIETFVAMHAAMRAGGVAVPVDSRFGADAVPDIVRSVEPAAAVLHPTTASRWAPGSRPRFTVGTGLDHVAEHLSWDEVEAGDARGPEPRLGSDRAYMITTSGSTGAPKSIVHTHHSGLRYAELAAACYGLRSVDRMANVAPFHFDHSTFAATDAGALPTSKADTQVDVLSFYGVPLTGGDASATSVG